MSDSNSNEELNAKTICCDCVSESFLTVEIKTKGEKTACSYCGQSTECISILDMTNRVEKAFEQHYSRTCEPDETDIMLGNDRKGKPVVEAIAEAVGLSYEVEQAATDINTILYRRHYNEKDAKKGWEQEFDTNSYYERNELEAPQWVEAWNAFTDSFKYNNRFFNQSSSKLLKSIFKDVDKIETKSGQSLIIEAGPDTKYPEIYRARVFQSIQKLEKAITYPDKELGPPPSGIASAGRMNAQGISVFYGATKPKVALAEIRPPVGSQVAIARFEIIKKLNLLDLTALETVSIKGSIFDPEYTKRVEREVFLKTLG